MSKKFDDDFMSGKGEVLLFFQFMADLKQSGSQILDSWSVKHIFSLIVTFYLTKTENRT